MGGREKLESIKNLKGRITYCKQQELMLGNDQNFDDAGVQQKLKRAFIKKLETVEKVAEAFHRCEELM